VTLYIGLASLLLKPRVAQTVGVFAEERIPVIKCTLANPFTASLMATFELLQLLASTGTKLCELSFCRKGCQAVSSFRCLEDSYNELLYRSVTL